MEREAFPRPRRTAQGTARPPANKESGPGERPRVRGMLRLLCGAGGEHEARPCVV